MEAKLLSYTTDSSFFSPISRPELPNTVLEGKELDTSKVEVSRTNAPPPLSVAVYQAPSDDLMELSSRVDTVTSNSRKWTVSLIKIQRAMSDADESNFSVVDGVYKGAPVWDDFMAGARKSGSQLNSYVTMAADIVDKYGAGKEFHDFISFAGDLSGEDMKNLISTANNAPEELPNIISTAAKISHDDRGNFLLAAKNSGGDVGLFMDRINAILDDNQNGNNVQIGAFLEVAAASEDRLLDFLDATGALNETNAVVVVDFINSDIESRRDLNNIIDILQGADEGKPLELIDIASSLNDEDKSNLLNAGSKAQKQLGAFVDSLTSFSNAKFGDGVNDLSNYLKIASKSEDRIETLVEISSQLDLGLVSQFSVVDTVNFLDAAKNADGQLGKLTKLSNELSGENRSNLLYAAARSKDNLGEFFEELAPLSKDDVVNFVSEVAKEGTGDNDRAVYLQGLLSKNEYADFQAGSSLLIDDELLNAVKTIGELEGQNRSNFIKTMKTGKEFSDQINTVFKQLSVDEQGDLLELAQGLGEGSLKKLINTTEKIGDSFSDFTSVAKELKNSNSSGFDNFLSTSEDADSQNIQKLVALVDELGEQQQTIGKKKGVNDMLNSFLRVASEAGQHLSDLMGMAEKVIPLGEKSFVEIFNSAHTATNKHLGTFIKTYA